MSGGEENHWRGIENVAPSSSSNVAPASCCDGSVQPVANPSKFESKDQGSDHLRFLIGKYLDDGSDSDSPVRHSSPRSKLDESAMSGLSFFERAIPGGSRVERFKGSYQSDDECLFDVGASYEDSPSVSPRSENVHVGNAHEDMQDVSLYDGRPFGLARRQSGSQALVYVHRTNEDTACDRSGEESEWTDDEDRSSSQDIHGVSPNDCSTPTSRVPPRRRDSLRRNNDLVAGKFDEETLWIDNGRPAAWRLKEWLGDCSMTFAADFSRASVEEEESYIERGDNNDTGSEIDNESRGDIEFNSEVDLRPPAPDISFLDDEEADELFALMDQADQNGRACDDAPAYDDHDGAYDDTSPVDVTYLPDDECAALFEVLDFAEGQAEENIGASVPVGIDANDDTSPVDVTYLPDDEYAALFEALELAEGQAEDKAVGAVGSPRWLCAREERGHQPSSSGDCGDTGPIGLKVPKKKRGASARNALGPNTIPFSIHERGAAPYSPAHYLGLKGNE
eukprot:TRINITY_DN1831_c0_g1_i1.p1 TRINITY_DN1831_c0_g1~~TRINITY_DN1831_c0_g1_i1.p1  ORF type:complete len:508 (+),score=67.33 TRINITY_DN1831_c0_g1_i1:124-1647(+)